MYQALPLDFVIVEVVEQYITQKYPDHDFPPEFPAFVQSRTDGNPLFMCDLLRDMQNRAYNGTPMLRYRFVHALYQNALLASIPPTRRAKLHHAVAQTLLEYEGSPAKRNSNSTGSSV